MIKRFWIGVGALLLLAALGWGGCAWQSKRSKALSWQPLAVERGHLKVWVMTTGSVRPQNRVEIKPPIGGRMESVLVNEGDSIKMGQILAWMSSTERAMLLDAARSKGPETLAYWEQLYKPVPIIAPLDGDIIYRKVEPGQTVSAGEVLLAMSDRLIVQATVDETDIGRVSRGQRAELTLDAYPTHVITGKVDEIAYEAKTVNNVTVYTVDVLPDTVPAFLRSGMTANLKIVVAQTHQALLLPTDAITMEGSAATVKVANPSDPAAPKTVTIVTGLSDNRKVEIVSGLQEGDSVLIPVKSLGLPRNRQGKSNSTNPFSPFGRPKK